MGTTDWRKNVLKLALCLFAVPVLGWLTGVYLERTYEGQFRQALMERKLEATLPYLQLCSNLESEGITRTDPAAAELCSPAQDVHNVFLASAAIAGLGVVLMLLIVGAKAIAGANRQRMSAVFGPLIRIVLILLAVSILAQGALFVFSIYTLEVAAIHRVHGVLLVLVGFGALAVCFQLLKSALSFFKMVPTFVRGTALDREKYNDLYALVEGVAKKLGAQPPKNIVMGLEPNFYVTTNEVVTALPETRLTGSTLYVSLSLLRLLSRAELCAVIGHELGHFRGEDTAYSLRFAPTYTRLAHTISAIASGRSGGASDLARLPALQALIFCWMQFASAERSVGRERELLADQAGAEAESARTLALALVKVATFAPIWNDVVRQNISELAEGRAYHDLSQVFGVVCESIHKEGSETWKQQLTAVAESRQPHPVDTHPPLAARLAALHLSLADISEQDLAPPAAPSLNLVPDGEERGKALTVLEDQYLVAIGEVVLPKETQQA